MKRIAFVFVVAAALVAPSLRAADSISYEPKKAGPGKGKHVVLLAGDEEYRSEEGLPMLAKILSQKHGFTTTVCFSLGQDGTIDPTAAASLSNPEALDKADAIVMLLRFRKYPDAIMQKFDAAVKRGIPIIGLRTSTHAFNGLKGTYESYNNFGKDVLGERWVSHWGVHKKEATRGVIEPGRTDEPILRGVVDVFGDSDVYEAHPPADAKILLRGRVLKGMNPVDVGADYSKKRSTDKVEQPVNDPMMPIAWTRELPVTGGDKKQRIFCTTMGAATDLESDGLRRLVVNAVYWGLGIEIPKKVDAGLVDAFTPTKYGFKGFRVGLKPDDFALGKSLPPPSDAAGLHTPPEVEKAKARSLPASALPLELVKGERLALVGNSTAERMNLFGNFETDLHLRHPQLQVVFRNFARPADEVALRQRASDYTKIDDPLKVFGPETFLCFFGFNESFAGKLGVEKFEKDYEKFLDEYAATYARDNAGSKPRFVIVSPMAFEASGDPLMPAGKTENENLALYAEACRNIAQKRGLAFVDIYTSTAQSFAAEPGLQYTINGAHTNAAGDALIAELLDAQLFGSGNPANLNEALKEQVRAEVNEKSWLHLQDYRMVNGWYVYGGRRTWDTETFPREYVKLRNMAAVHDARIWDLAAGKQPAGPADYTKTGDLIVPPTRFGEPRQAYSENPSGGPVILPPDELIKTVTVPPGFEMKLFADEKRFPEIAKPVQMTFDSKGRLWVSTMPSYPQWRPGDPKPSDKLVILEDTDADGSADKSTVFYDKLHCPTGFEFFNGGVLVVNQPRMVWLQDTDGDDKADLEVNVLDGWATEDTHHTIGAFESGHGGQLHMLEGVAMSTAIETPWGAFRNFGSSGCYVLDPRTWKVRHFKTPGYGNPWCYVFNEWGQGICGDGTGANQHWDTPLSSAAYPGRKGMNPVFPTEGMRPVVGSEYLISRQFPDDVQGQFIYACVINMNGMPRWTISDDGAGYKGVRVRHNPDDAKTPYDLLKSTDKHFRPVDPQIGPDGALWFGDWANPLIGHMQYSQRDPNRDHIHGRIYRLVYKDKPLMTPVTQHGKTNEELFEQFREYEWRTRVRARRELQGRPQAEVLAALKALVAKLSPSDEAYDRLRCEALWLQQSFHAVDAELLKQVLAAKKPEARAAAVRVLSEERDFVPEAFALLQTAAVDENPRAAVEAVRGLSFFSSTPSAAAVLNGLAKHSGDTYMQYTADAALGATLAGWRGGMLKGELAANDPGAKKILDAVIATDKQGAQLLPYLQILLGREQKSEEEKNKALTALSDMGGGNADNGKVVFRRSCTACHKVYNEGADFGPDMMKVGTRLKPFKILQSIIDPNADIEPKYLSTQIVTDEGLTISGLLVSETPESVVIFDGKEKKTIPVKSIEERNKLKQSSMPEGLASTLSPVELLDLLAFLKSLK
ncbi:MAG: HEAT repeat domain-containing protein [Pirellulales bacterium]